MGISNCNACSMAPLVQRQRYSGLPWHTSVVKNSRILSPILIQFFIGSEGITLRFW
jgi:hypothetical protein